MVSTRSKSGGAAASSTEPQKLISKPKTSKDVKKAAVPKVALKEGDLLPQLSLLSDEGKHVSTHSFFTADTPGLILFTYPRANTGGCTAQAVGLSGMADDAKKAGYSIVGCSYDSVKSQAGWKAKRELKMTLLCDSLDVGFLKKIGAHKAPKGVVRSVFVVKKDKEDAKLLLIKRGISPKDCVSLMQDYVKDHVLVGEGKDVSEDPDAKAAE